MRVLVTGKSGQVVTAIISMAAGTDIDIITLGRPEVDFSQPDTLYATAIDLQPDIIISAAAYTAVDQAETEADIAFAVNSVAPGILARAAKALNIPIIHLSTDYVFDGDSSAPYDETDPTNPVNVYGLSKLKGEQAIATQTDNHIILRTTWVYSPYGNNFLKTMLRLAETRDEIKVVADQLGCPTSAMEIARAVLEIARRVATDPSPELRGIFHLTAQGETSWAGFAIAILEETRRRGKTTANVHPIPSSEYPTPARRPSNSRLSGKKLAGTYGIRLEPWERSMNNCLDALHANGR